MERNFVLESGQPIKLEPWQRENILEPVFRMDDGRRAFDTFLVGIPKKNGKSTLAASVAAYALLLYDPSPEVYSAAGDLDQAGIIFRTVKKAFNRSPRLRPLVKIYKDVIERVDGNGFYKVLSSDAPGSLGLNASCVIWDELWNQPSYDLWEALTHFASPKKSVSFCRHLRRISGALRKSIVGFVLARCKQRRPLAIHLLAKRSRCQPSVVDYGRIPGKPATASAGPHLPATPSKRMERCKRYKSFPPPARWAGSFENAIPNAKYIAGIDLAKSRDFAAWAIIRTDSGR